MTQIRKQYYKGIKINGKKIDEHRHIMEKHLGRKLASSEVVHHIDGNKLNNDINNLQLVSRAEHMALHRQQLTASSHSEEAVKKCADTLRAYFKEHKHVSCKKVAQLDRYTGEILRTFDSMHDATPFGFNHRHISACCSGKRKTHKGYRWSYCDDE